MRLGTVTQQPSEIKNYSVFYTDALDAGDEVVEVVSCETTPLGLSASAALVDATRVRLTVKEGVAGATYKISLLVHTGGGERFEDELFVKVKEI